MGHVAKEDCNEEISWKKEFHIFHWGGGVDTLLQYTIRLSASISCPLRMDGWMAEVYSGWITGWLLGLTRQWDESPSSRTRGAPYPAVCGARQPPGSRERKADDLLPFFAASCSADLERPCWFSQSRREAKGDRRERRLTGRQPENTARMMWLEKSLKALRILQAEIYIRTAINLHCVRVVTTILLSLSSLI